MGYEHSKLNTYQGTCQDIRYYQQELAFFDQILSRSHHSLMYDVGNEKI